MTCRSEACGPVRQKRCCRCKEWKPLDGFYRNRVRPDGRCNTCAQCFRPISARTKRRNYARRTAYHRTFPVKRRAKGAVQSALAAGKLKRQPCEQCGAEPADAHHDDYAKPLEVRWLCRAHHMEWHRLNGPGLNGEGVSSLTHLEDTEQAAE